MRSFLAVLRTLVLPYGATSGRRIVIDGVNARILFYSATNTLVIEQDANTSRISIGDQTGSYIRLDALAKSLGVVSSSGYYYVKIAASLGGTIELGTADAAEVGAGFMAASSAGNQRSRLTAQTANIGGHGTVEFDMFATDSLGNVPLVQFEGLGNVGYIDLSDAKVTAVRQIKAATFVGLNNLPTFEDWTAATFASPWANFGGTSQTLYYRKTALNDLQVTGILKTTAGVSSGSSILTFPAAVRPAVDHEIPVAFNNPSVAAKLKVTAATGVLDLRHFTGPVTVTEMGVEFSIPLDVTM